MSYKKIRGCSALPYERIEHALNLKEAVVRFIYDRCENLRFDDNKEHEEQKGKVLLGRSISDGQIPYNMQMDIDRLCLENALKRFLDSGAAQDAFDVYYCYLEMFVGCYGSSKRMIEMLSEFEMNGSSLLMKHRDHYSHSVYVFCLGLAIYETNQLFRMEYMKFYGFDSESETDVRKAAHHFLEYWGLAALFHDIGYPFELPFEQVESYFEVDGQKRNGNPFVAYLGMEKFTVIDSDTAKRLQKLYQEKDNFDSTDELFAYDIARKLGKTYHFTKESMQVVLETKPANPNRFGYFMDHAYFSATILFHELLRADRMEGRTEIPKERIDALSAIILHNSLYKFSVAFYKNKTLNHEFQMQLHPLAYMLMLCDELQCWDRTSYGRNSRRELHPMDCDLTFDHNRVHAVYVYDQEEQQKIDDYEKQYEDWKNGRIEKEPKLKAYAGMVHDNDFLKDIGRIVDLSGWDLTIDVATRPAVHKGKQAYLSDSKFINLYYFAVALNARYSDPQGGAQEVTKKMENDFNRLSLEYKLSNIGQAKAFAEYLDVIGCFYTDKPVDFEMVTKISQEDMDTIGPLEHGRWLKEHQNMGWRYGTDYNSKAEREQKRIHNLAWDGELTPENIKAHYDDLSDVDKDKDTEPMNRMLELLKMYDGLRIYRLKRGKEM